MIQPPSPHPLDFDWRYDDGTAQALATLLSNSPPLLAIGAPTVARLLEGSGVDVTLVDRQPIQAVRRHVVCDAVDFIPDRAYRTALVDPPWYPAQLNSWSRAAASAVGAGGAVFVSVWPDATRPSAAAEVALALSGFSRWAHVSRNVATLRYTPPRFEVAARKHAQNKELSRSPLVGELVRLDVWAPPPVGQPQESAARWLRFTIDDYQLAIRHRPGRGLIHMESISSADGWQWPYVSARAPCINQIDIWSSDGEVARLESSEHIIDLVRQALRARDADAFERTLIDVPTLLSWRIPRPPYRRLIEWQHRQ